MSMTPRFGLVVFGLGRFGLVVFGLGRFGLIRFVLGRFGLGRFGLAGFVLGVGLFFGAPGVALAWDPSGAEPLAVCTGAPYVCSSSAGNGTRTENGCGGTAEPWSSVSPPAHSHLAEELAGPASACFAPPAVLPPEATPASAPRRPAQDQAHAAAAWARFVTERDTGQVERALVTLATLRALRPELDDRWSLELGRVGSCDDPQTLPALERAAASPILAVAAEARVERVRCLLSTDARFADRELSALVRRYPELPRYRELQLLQAESYERRGRLRDAIALWSELDLLSPESAEARSARDALTRVAASGVRLTSYTDEQWVDRADRLVRVGPPDLARAELARLDEARLSRTLQSRLLTIRARLAAVEGRFADADRLIRASRGQSTDSPPRVGPTDTELRTAAQDSATQRLRELAGRNQRLGRIPSVRLHQYLSVAARAGLVEPTNAALDALKARDTTCHARLEAVFIASGIADDVRIAELLEPCSHGANSVSVAARYHRARALERAGQWSQARELLREVVHTDASETRWYALWAEQRLESLAEAGPGLTPPLREVSLRSANKTGSGFEWLNVSSPTALLPEPPSLAELPASSAEVDDAAEPLPPMTTARAIERLRAIGERVPAGYPWLNRAALLLELGDTSSASDEIHEAYLAYREARGNAPLRSGVEAVYRGASRPRIRAESGDVMIERRSLTPADRDELSQITAFLGEHGLSLRLGGFRGLADLPRPYEQIVEEVAAERGIDPNLLFAVMRVESVFEPRIVSYAGAVGLMQIMPRTGRLIARSMGRTDFSVDQLLDPRTNIEFGAWYLSSLIRRFEGRVPLAVASYNGGPHNVRRWLNDHSDRLPLDAFLERIPYEQTHRYVRRVLGHWRSYRAQRGESMVRLDTELPALAVDAVAF